MPKSTTTPIRIVEKDADYEENRARHEGLVTDFRRDLKPPVGQQANRQQKKNSMLKTNIPVMPRSTKEWTEKSAKTPERVRKVA